MLYVCKQATQGVIVSLFVISFMIMCNEIDEFRVNHRFNHDFSTFVLKKFGVPRGEALFLNTSNTINNISRF